MNIMVISWLRTPVKELIQINLEYEIILEYVDLYRRPKLNVFISEDQKIFASLIEFKMSHV